MANAATAKTATPHAAPHLPATDTAAVSAFTYAMLTDPGRVRHGNQDACAAAPDHAAFVVCDGVGGAAGGEVASQLATETFLAALRSSANASANNARVPHSSHDGSRAMSGNEESPTHPHARLHQAIEAANNAVFQRAQKVRTLRGMATTLVAALLEYPTTAPNDGVPHPYATEMARMGGMNTDRAADDPPNFCPTLWLAHAGDSRAYRLRRAADGEPYEITQLTCDHSLVEEQVRAGLLSRHDALRSPVRNVITRAVGAAPSVEPEIAAHEIQPGDLYLLASDGLTRELTDPAIARILSATLQPEGTAGSLEADARAAGTSPPPTQPVLERAARALIDAANNHGGRDNITVLLLGCS